MEETPCHEMTINARGAVGHQNTVYLLKIYVVLEIPQNCLFTSSSTQWLAKPKLTLGRKKV